MNEKDIEISRIVDALDEAMLFIKSTYVLSLENYFSVWKKELDLLDNYKQVTCPDCEGVGTFTIGHNGIHTVNANCGTCNGEKYIWEKKNG